MPENNWKSASARTPNHATPLFLVWLVGAGPFLPGGGLRSFAGPWPATDGLGRALPTYEAVRAPRKDRLVAVFHFHSLGQCSDAGPNDRDNFRAKFRP